MTRRPHEPLSPEEQALAAGLPRLAGRSAPTAEIDARILALARAPAAAPSPRRPRRWQVPTALAATLCLAAGIAWQLRTTPTRHAQMDNARPIVVAAEPALHAPARPMAPDAMSAPPLVGPAQQSAARSPAPAVSAQIGRADRARTEGAAAPPAGDTQAAPPPAAPAAATAQSLPVPPPAPPAAAPVPMVSAFPEQAPAPAAERSAQSAQENPSRERAVPAEPARPKTLAPPAARAAARPFAAPPTKIQPHSATSSAARPSAMARDAEDDDDLPPATMNSASARAAWLRRIAELAQAGQLEEARASLAEFRRRYPNERIPDALKALETPAEP